MATYGYHQCCRAWGVDIEDQHNESVSCVMFEVDVFALLLLKPTPENIRQTGGLDNSLQHFTFTVNGDELIKDGNKIRGIFHFMQIQPQQHMIDTILDCARCIASTESHRQNRKILGMQVSIVVGVDEFPVDSGEDNDLPINDDDGYDDDDDDDAVLAPTFRDFVSMNFDVPLESLITPGIEEDSPRTVPASKESIEKLERVEVQDSMTQCVICLDALAIGSKATIMPCLHMFHGDCIIQWLEKRNSCPLCRRELA